MKVNEEWGLYSLLLKQNSFLKKALIVSFLVALLSIATTLETLLVKRDKVVLLDYQGRPQIVGYVDDEVFKTEVDFFARMLISKIFSVHYGMIINSEEWKKYVNDLAPFFASGFLSKFINALKDTGFYSIVAKEKLIVQPSVVAVRDLRIEGTTAIAYVTVGLSGVGREGGATYEERMYEIRTTKGERTISNPWGLQLFYMVELSRIGSGFSTPTE